MIELKKDEAVANVQVIVNTKPKNLPLMTAVVDFQQFPGFTLTYFFDIESERWKLLHPSFL